MVPNYDIQDFKQLKLGGAHGPGQGPGLDIMFSIQGGPRSTEVWASLILGQA